MRHKKMSKKIEGELRKAGEMIAMNQESFICNCIDNTDWMKTSEALMIKTKDITSEWDSWFNVYNTDEWDFEERIKIRLLGIAIMITMPESILNHECSPSKK